jgi:hypothetical protein
MNGDRAGIGWRALAVIGVLVLGAIAGGFMAAVIDGYDIPTCEEVRSGDAAPSEDNECADTGKTQNAVSNVTGTIAAGLGALSLLALLAFAVTGRRSWVRRFALLLVAALLVLGATALVTDA